MTISIHHKIGSVLLPASADTRKLVLGFAAAVSAMLLSSAFAASPNDTATQAAEIMTDQLDITGTWMQGALLHGKVAPGSQVEFLGNNVYVNPQGEFILGLGREAPKQVEVIVTDPKQQKHTHAFAVTQREYHIQRVDGVDEKFVTPDEAEQKRIDEDNHAIAEARRVRDTRADFAQGFTWPVHGPISGVYGSQRIFNGVPKQPHYGLDIAAPTGTPVHAPAGGKVTLVRDTFYSGWTLILDHGQGLSSGFLHMSKVLVKVGDTVKQGDVIGEVGATGRVTAAHLDWRMNWLDQRLDVQLLLPPATPEP